MDKALIVFTLVVLLFCARGYFLGLPRVAVRLVALVAGYVVVIPAASPAGEWLERNTALEGFAPIIVAMLALFLGTVTLMVALGALTIHLTKVRGESPPARAGGALLNTVFGTVVALVAVWFSAQAYAALYPDERFSTSGIQRLADSTMSHVFSRLALRGNPEKPAQAETAGRIAASPVETMQDLRYLSDSGKMHELFLDPEVRKALRRGDTDRVVRSEPFRALGRDQRFRDLMVRGGLVDPEASIEAQNGQAVARISDMYRRVEAVREHPEFRAIVDDPDFQKRLYSGNIWQIVNDPRGERLMELVQSAEPREPASSSGTAAQASPAGKGDGSTPEGRREPAPVHRWQDDQGRWHFSDRAPEE